MSSVAEIAEATGILRELAETFASQLSRGELTLFTGAGFSLDAVAADGQPLPRVDELKAILWPIAFPGESIDPDSRLSDIFECAVQQSRTAVERELRRCLTVDHTSLGVAYETWFSMPWRRIYTVNIDDLDEAANRAFGLPVPLRSLSALSDSVPATGHELLVVHLNGKLTDGANATFSPLQYAERLPGADVWYPTLAKEIAGRAFVYVGSVLDESPLWQHLAMRGQRPAAGRELRPKSYLVTPSLPAARRRLLADFNIVHIECDQATFAGHVLANLREEAEAGQQVLRRRHDRRNRSPLISVDELRATRDTQLQLSHYLLGREPVFDDITDGYAIVRDFETGWTDDPSFFEPRITLITGTAGSGKSTTLRRLALEIQARGLDVRWLDTETDVAISGIHNFIKADTPDVVVIDDADVFGGQTGPFLLELVKASPDLRVIASSRSTRAERFDVARILEEVDSKLVVVPPLHDSDIDGLIGALGKAGVLGSLVGKPAAEQRRLLGEHSGRQLLVAMIEATSGKRFEDKIDDECSQLTNEQALLYAIVALSTRLRAWLTKEEILLAAGGRPVEHLADLDALVRQHLIVERLADQFYVRHRVVAERATGYFRRTQHLAPAIEGLLWVMATKLSPATGRYARERQLAVRLMNHKFMLEEIGNLPEIRPVYESVKTLLAKDAHYWLQRGSLEVEHGDLDLAENYLNQARGLSPNDYKIQTEYAYMALKRAAEDTAAGVPGWRERADEAFAELAHAIRQRGKTDSYPYHVLGSQGLRYARRAPFTSAERAALLSTLLEQIDAGLRYHAGNAELRQLRADVEREYLLQAVGDGSAPNSA